MLFADLTLSRRLENAEGQAGAAHAETRRKRQPELNSAWENIDGTVAIYDGPESPITQTFALGLSGPVTPVHLDRVESFFRERGAHVHHEISPMADESLWPLLTKRGYTPIEFTSILYRELTEGAPTEYAGNLEVRPVEARDTETLIRVNQEGWGNVAGIGDFGDLVRTMSSAAGVRSLIAWSEGEPIAAASLNIQGSIALLAGACTIPEARGRGAQRALLEARLHLARALGCDVACMGAQSGSGSQRNAERAGFRIAYTRTKWQLNLP